MAYDRAEASKNPFRRGRLYRDARGLEESGTEALGSFRSLQAKGSAAAHRLGRIGRI